MDKKSPYPEWIMQKVRANLGLDDDDDTSRDEEIGEMSKKTVLRRCLEWEGIIGYTNMITDFITDIYGVRLTALGHELVIEEVDKDGRQNDQ